MLLKGYRKLQDIIYTLLGLMLAVVVILIFVGVITRYVFFYSIPWSEELSRYLFVWMIFLGAGFSVRDQSEMKVDILEQLIKGRAKRVLGVFHTVVSLIVACITMVSAYNLLAVGQKSISPNLHLPMNIVYFGEFLGFVLISIELVLRLIEPLIIKRSESTNAVSEREEGAK